MIKLIGCNNHLGVGETGLTKNIETIKQLRNDLNFIEVNEVIVNNTDNPKLRNFESVLATSEQLAKANLSVLKQKYIPLNILGDHAASIGTVSASSMVTDNLGVLWVDAHSDINTPSTTFSGNIHGMTNAALLNLFDGGLNNIVFNGQKLVPENLSFIGLRDIDPGELEILKRLKIDYYTYQDVLDKGLENILKLLVNKFKQVDKLHLSIDMDSMNPKIIKAVSVPVENGFTPNDVKTIINTLVDEVPICNIDIVEYNPEYDENNESANVLFELIDLIKDRLD